MDTLTTLFKNKSTEIEEWFQEKQKGHLPPVYFSCDLRHSGYKISVVDTNLFPAGFNNLCSSYLTETAQAFKEYFHTYYPSARKILLLGESHTRNKFYLKNLQALNQMLHYADLESRIGILPGVLDKKKLNLILDEISLDLYTIERSGSQIMCDDFVPDLILSNNDFSTGIPDILKAIQQPVIPSPELGWHDRAKSFHFEWLTSIIVDFCQTFGIDPWLIDTQKAVAYDVNLTDEASLHRLAEKIQKVIENIELKFREYKINQSPYVYLKNNSGTYGMGILPIFSGDDILKLNRKQRNKLLASKGGKQTFDFMIQEGIPTADFYSEYPIEPVLYSVGFKSIGGFFRIHPTRNHLESLNAPGMTFSCLCLHRLEEPHEDYFLNCHEKEHVVFISRILVRLAGLATALEMKAKG